MRSRKCYVFTGSHLGIPYFVVPILPHVLLSQRLKHTWDAAPCNRLPGMFSPVWDHIHYLPSAPPHARMNDKPIHPMRPEIPNLLPDLIRIQFIIPKPERQYRKLPRRVGECGK